MLRENKEHKNTEQKKVPAAFLSIENDQKPYQAEIFFNDNERVVIEQEKKDYILVHYKNDERISHPLPNDFDRGNLVKLSENRFAVYSHLRSKRYKDGEYYSIINFYERNQSAEPFKKIDFEVSNKRYQYGLYYFKVSETSLWIIQEVDRSTQLVQWIDMSLRTVLGFAIQTWSDAAWRWWREDLKLDQGMPYISHSKYFMRGNDRWDINNHNFLMKQLPDRSHAVLLNFYYASHKYNNSFGFGIIDTERNALYLSDFLLNGTYHKNLLDIKIDVTATGEITYETESKLGWVGPHTSFKHIDSFFENLSKDFDLKQLLSPHIPLVPLQSIIEGYIGGKKEFLTQIAQSFPEEKLKNYRVNNLNTFYKPIYKLSPAIHSTAEDKPKPPSSGSCLVM